MATEIERKFLVKKELLPESTESIKIEQAYLNDDPNRVTRVRIGGNKAFLTIKGKGTGISRPEFEYEIPLKDAEELMRLAIFPPIKKVRHIFYHENYKWEVDIFSGANQGLILAEIELASEDEDFNLPEWIGEEVSGDNRYFNSQLSKHPFSAW